MRFSLRRRKLTTFNDLKARRGSPPSCLWWCSVMFDSRRWRIHRVSCSFPPNGKRIIAASLKQCLHWTPSIQLSQTLRTVFFSSLEWRHAYLELHSEVPSNFHNPCSFFMSTLLLCASGQGNLSTEESCAASRSVLKWLFLCDCFLLKFMAAFFLIFFLHIFTPQVWRNRTDEFFSQYAADTESQGHHAHNRLDSDLGFACRSTGTVVSSWARLPWLFISISSLISNQPFWQPS